MIHCMNCIINAPAPLIISDQEEELVRHCVNWFCLQYRQVILQADFKTVPKNFLKLVVIFI